MKGTDLPTKSLIVQRLRELAGPLGPFTSMEERDAEQAQWHRALTPADAAVLVDLLYEPVAAADRGPALDWMFTMEIQDALAAIGRRDPPWFCALVGRAFAQRGANESLIAVLGEVGGDAAVELLVELSGRTTLSKDEQMALIGALGTLGGERARARLLGLREQLGPDGDPELLRDLDLALGEDGP